MPVPEPRLAIDLSGGLIRVVSGVMGGPMRAAAAGAPAGSLVEGSVRDPTAVGISLKQLLARTEITESRAMIAVSDAVATFRVLRFPAGTADGEIDSTVARELPSDRDRMAIRWRDLSTNATTREVYAVSWNRDMVKGAVDAAKMAGLEAAVVELKSTCLARTVGEPTCVVIDISSDPMDVVLIAGCVPRVWHSVKADVSATDNLAEALVAPLRSVLRFYKRQQGSDFGAGCPVLVSGEQVLPHPVVASLSAMIGHPIQPFPIPPRVPLQVRHNTYLTCLGLIMRRAR